MNKKAQLDFGLVTFLGIIIIILILAPILVNVVTTILGEVGTNINNTNVAAGVAVSSVETSFTNLWDIVIISLFLLNVILLLITAFLIDIHPAFMIMYILFCFFTIIFIPNVMDVVDVIYVQYSADVGQYLPLTEFMVDYFEAIILGIMVLSGIIIYAKIKYFGRQF